MEETDRQIGKSQAQIKLLESTIQKRQVQLEALDKDVEKEIQSKRQEIKVSTLVLACHSIAIQLPYRSALSLHAHRSNWARLGPTFCFRPLGVGHCLVTDYY